MDLRWVNGRFVFKSQILGPSSLLQHGWPKGTISQLISAGSCGKELPTPLVRLGESLSRRDKARRSWYWIYSKFSKKFQPPLLLPHFHQRSIPPQPTPKSPRIPPNMHPNSIQRRHQRARNDRTPILPLPQTLRNSRHRGVVDIWHARDQRRLACHLEHDGACWSFLRWDSCC